MAELTGSGRGGDPFAAAVRATRMPIVIADPRLADNPMVFVNDAFCRLTGYVRDEVVGRNCRFLQGPDTDPDAVARIRAAIAQVRPLEIDIRNYRKTGEPFWNRLIMAPVQDDRGELAYFVASQVDITLERQRLAGLENDNAALVVELAGRLRAHRDNEGRLRFAAQAGRLGHWELDLLSGELTASDLAKQNHGRDPAEPFTADQWRASIHPEDRSLIGAAIERSVTEGVDSQVECRVLRPNGSVGWVQNRAQVILAEDGTVARLIGVSLDITDRREADEERRLGHALLRGIIETAPGLIYAKDRDGRMLIANSPTLALIGKPWEEVRGRTDREFLQDAGQADTVMRNDRRVLDHGETIELEEVLGTGGKAPRIWLSTKTPLRAENGVITGMVGMSVDITTRKQAETELQLLNATLEARVAERTAERDRAWKNSQDLQVVVDREGIMRAANPAWTTILGWRTDEIVGQHVSALIHPDDLASSHAAHARALVDQLPAHETRFGHRDGGYRTIAWVATTEAGLIYASGRNVTAEREQAQALARVEELLRQSQKMEAVGQLTGGIAHDFNNLLGAITGSLELLQRRVEIGQFDNLERYTSAAVAAAERAASLTQRLLAFARRQPLDPKRVDANRLVAGMEDLIGRTLGPAITLEMLLAGDLWPTLCDPNQLESAILNLAINARDAMPDGGRLTIETANVDLDDGYARSQGGEVRPGQYVAIVATDTGVGMSSDIVARAFDPFFTTKPIGQGTGLGLSMLYGFVKQSEGHVRVTSDPGRGTTFRLYLPRQGEAADQDGPASGPTKPTPSAGLGETVLVVDDEPTLRMLVTETLEELGYAAIQAGDGISALRIVQSDASIDLLVTDVGLPGLNGRQLAEAARTVRPTLPVLFITGYAYNAAIGNGTVLEPGMEIITKPFALDVLARKIRAMIQAPGRPI